MASNYCVPFEPCYGGGGPPMTRRHVHHRCNISTTVALNSLIRSSEYRRWKQRRLKEAKGNRAPVFLVLIAILALLSLWLGGGGKKEVEVEVEVEVKNTAPSEEAEALEVPKAEVEEKEEGIEAKEPEFEEAPRIEGGTLIPALIVVAAATICSLILEKIYQTCKQAMARMIDGNKKPKEEDADVGETAEKAAQEPSGSEGYTHGDKHKKFLGKKKAVGGKLKGQSWKTRK